jgi:Uma2 family endonuclease
VDKKVQEWLEAGVPLLWLVNPDTQSVRASSASQSLRELHDCDKLTGDDIVPGFECEVRDLFCFPPGSA